MYVLQFIENWKLCCQAAAASTPDPNSVEAVAAVKQLVLSQIDKKLKDLREEGLIRIFLKFFCKRQCSTMCI